MTTRLSLLSAIISVIATIAMAGCSSVDTDRIPPTNVNVIFPTVGDWQRYGVAGAGQYQRFILTEGIPSGFPYKDAEATGYGGLLLVMDPMGQYLVYDLACPYCSPTIQRIMFDEDATEAGIFRCGKCGSAYDVYSYGTPYSGPAADKNNRYGLQRYKITISGGSPYAVIGR